MTTISREPSSPLALIVATSAMVSVGGFFAGVFGRAAVLDWDGAAMLRFGLLGLGLGPVLLFVAAAVIWRKTLLYAAEQLTGVNLNNDAYIGAPPPEPEPGHMLVTNAPMRERAYQLPAGTPDGALTRSEMREIIHYLYTVPNWNGREGLKGRTMQSGKVLDYKLHVEPFLNLLGRNGLLVGRKGGARGNVQGDEGGALAALDLL